MGFDVTVRMSGPVLEGRAPEIVNDYLDDALGEVARQGYADVMANLNTALRRPTPYYETQVTYQRMIPSELWLIHDRDIIYGPWLEGTGSRNRTTRFKGYASFRRAAQTLDRRAGELAEYVFRARWWERLR